MNSVKIFRFHNHTCWGLMLFVASMILPVSPRTVPYVNLERNAPFEVNNLDTIDCIDCNPLIFGERLDINRATLGHLQSLPQIGPSRAQAIVELRKERGGFKQIEELEDVRGIGPKTLIKLMPYILVEP